MDDIKYLSLFLSGGGLVVAVLLFFCLFSGASYGGDTSEITSTYFIVPFKDNITYKVTSPYGKRGNPLNVSTSDFHNGVDFSASEGTEIVASADGTVIKADWEDGGGGYVVVIDHKIEGVKYQTAYAHLKEDSIVVTVGQKIQAKQTIAVIGDTGNVTGVHLHFEIHTPIRVLPKDNTVAPKNSIDPMSVVKIK